MERESRRANEVKKLVVDMIDSKAWNKSRNEE